MLSDSCHDFRQIVLSGSVTKTHLDEFLRSVEHYAPEYDERVIQELKRLVTDAGNTSDYRALASGCYEITGFYDTPPSAGVLESDLVARLKQL